MSETEDNRQWWKCLEEKRGDADFLEGRKNEFSEELPFDGGMPVDSGKISLNRRDFLKLMGFGLTAVTAACSRMPVKKALPYLNKPEEIVPGKSYWYASTCDGCTASCGVLVKNREGRPIKLEGNDASKLNQGGLCGTGQATLLGLYDSGRLQAPVFKNATTSWKDVDGRVLEALTAVKNSGKAVRLVSRSVTSPSTQKVIEGFLGGFADAKHVVYDAVSFSALIAAHEKAFGVPFIPHYRFDRADVVVSFGADFLGSWLSPVEFTKNYSKRRDLSAKQRVLHHVQFENLMSLTGANADVRVPLGSSGMQAALLYLLAKVDPASGNYDAPLEDKVRQTIDDVASKLLAALGRSIVISGSNDEAEQSVVAQINATLKNYGRTLETTRVSRQKTGRDSSMQELIQELRDGKVGALVFYEANPAYDYSGESWKDLLSKVDFKISLARYENETAKLCDAVCPDHHFLESWNDAEPVTGVFHLTQPAIQPVYDTRQAQDSLLIWAAKGISYYEFLRSTWGLDWNKALHDGYYDSLTASLGTDPVYAGDVTNAVSALRKSAMSQDGDGAFILALYESPALRDGSLANNPWLQELPDPVTKVTWDNVVTVAPTDAKKLGLQEGDVVTLTADKKSVQLPVYVQPGQHPGVLGVALGYGRTAAGKVGNGVGANAYVFWNAAGRGKIIAGVTFSKNGDAKVLATTQKHHSMEGRDLVRETTLEKFEKNPSAGNPKPHGAVMLWNEHKETGHSWGMAIDLNRCTGCSACLVGCQSENNVPVVGRDEVAKSREMSWIRIDRYFGGDESNPDTVFQPMMCQHCGNAPCESVCPVLATVHSTDGLNQQVYNRCVGTRYCANNCPYKVRRFNWFDYAQNKAFDYYMNDDVGRLVLNPDIVVRSRGVMEKCSMCVQRIQEGKLQAKLEGRELKDGEIRTACQQSCPADAIVFGDLNDPKSRVAKLVKETGRGFRVLEELNVQPAVSYLTKVRNR